MKPAKKTVLSAALLTLLLGLGSGAEAVSVFIDASDAGFVTESGGSAKGDGTTTSATYNYSVGREVHYPPPGFPTAPATWIMQDRNNYFTFDLSGVTEPITGATLKLWTGTYESVDATETFDVLAPSDPGAAIADADFLLVANGIGPGEFDDAGDPALGISVALYGNIEGSPLPALGTFVVSSADDDSMISIPLTGSGIGYLNDFAGGIAFLGGSVSTAPGPGASPTSPPVSPQQPFGLTGPDIPGGDPLTPVLILEVVPEPTSGILLVFGLLFFGLRRRR